MPMFQYAGRAHLNMLAMHDHGRGTRLGTCLVCATCAVAMVVCVTSDGLFCSKSLLARKQDASAIQNNNLVLQTAANYNTHLQARYPIESITFHI